MDTVEQRLARLEALEEIRMLKHRYFRACDAKDPEAMRRCFVAHGADIYYGPALGSFDDADAWSTSTPGSLWNGSTTATSCSTCITACIRAST